MKETIYELYERTVDIPEKCPHCGQDFHEEDSLREWDYVGEGCYGAIDPKTGEFESAYDWEGGEDYNVCDFICASCGKSVVPTEPLSQNPVFQFPRLLSALAHALSDKEVTTLSETIDLDPEEVRVVLDTAIKQWKDLKPDYKRRVKEERKKEKERTDGSL